LIASGTLIGELAIPKLGNFLVLRIFLDGFVGLLSTFLAAVLRFDGPIPGQLLPEVFQFALTFSFVQVSLQYVSSAYSKRYKPGTFEEFLILGFCTFFSVLIAYIVRIFFYFDNLPRSLIILTGMVYYIILIASRVTRRPFFKFFSTNRSQGRPALIYGAGEAGRKLLEEILRFDLKQKQFKVVGFLDDDNQKKSWRILGLRVLGSIEKLESVVRQKQAEVLIVAISSLTYEKLSNLESQCKSIGIELRIIPSTYDLVSGALSLSDFRDINEENLLGRRQVRSNLSELASLIGGKRVLVTGAGGSIGSEIVRQITQFGPEQLLKLDRDENALLNLQLGLVGNGLWLENDLILADIRDSSRIDEIFEEFKPQIVFHAAALKHLPILERFPEEAFKTNVQGTKNILSAAKRVGVETFINISTDKASDPKSVLGQGKLLTERFTAGIELTDSSIITNKYISVRFGNVIGSNGSFIHTFRQQIAQGGPVTVTHPEVTRYFMTVSEAVHLVLQSILIGGHGETLVLDMGEPVKINSIAKMMIRRSGKVVDIKYTGLRPGEKLHETLFTDAETIGQRKHEFIMHCQVDPLKLEIL
jgi:FlaA1/EpsC-like NDP-sugar epimerase